MKKEDKKVVNYNPNIEFLLYKTDNEEIKVDVLLQDENIWMSQKKMAELFDVDRTVIAKHFKNIFESGELEEDSVYSIFNDNLTLVLHGF